MNGSSEVINLLITPAIMISATGLLLLSVNQRTGRIADRLREILDELRTVEPEGSRHETLIRQLKSLRTRGRLTQRSVTAFLIAVFLFVLTGGGLILELVGGGFKYLPAGLFYVALFSLMAGLACYLMEIRESFRISSIELEYWLDEN